MMFTVLVAGDVGGKTYNFEFSFPTHPTLTELLDQVESVFTREAVQTVAVGRMQMYDTVAQKWVELASGRQLKDNCQVFIFQAETGAAAAPLGAAVQSGSPADLRTGSAFPVSKPDFSAGALPLRTRSHGRTRLTHHPTVLPPAVEPSQGDRARYSFDFLDASKSRRVTPADLREAMRKILLDFAPPTLESLFRKADSNGDGVVTFAEWDKFCNCYPKLTDSIFMRIQQFNIELAKRAELGAHQEELAKLRDAAAEKRALCNNRLMMLEEQRAKLQRCDSFFSEAKMREAEVSENHHRAEESLDVVGGELADANRNREHAQERERERAAALEEAQASIDHAGRSVSDREGEVNQSRERIRQLEYELEQVRRLLAKQEAEKEGAVQALMQCQDMEMEARGLLAEAQKGTQRAHEVVSQIDDELVRAQDAVRIATASERDAARSTAAAEQQREGELREVRVHEDRLRGAEESHHEAEARAAEAAQFVAELATQLEEFSAELARTAEEEHLIIDEELRLKDQREQLEEREARLGAAHSRYRSRQASIIYSPTAAGAGKPASVPRNRSPDGYMYRPDPLARKRLGGSASPPRRFSSDRADEGYAAPPAAEQSRVSTYRDAMALPNGAVRFAPAAVTSGSPRSVAGAYDRYPVGGSAHDTPLPAATPQYPGSEAHELAASLSRERSPWLGAAGGSSAQRPMPIPSPFDAHSPFPARLSNLSATVPTTTFREPGLRRLPSSSAATIQASREYVPIDPHAATPYTYSTSARPASPLTHARHTVVSYDDTPPQPTPGGIVRGLAAAMEGARYGAYAGRY